jgi:alkylation response protein AidB-like acyl-CoA dehydrogenase
MLPKLSEEHEIFRKSVSDFVAKEITPKAHQWELDGEVPRDLFRKLGELGFLGVRLPEEYGGSGLDFWYTTILLQELMKCGSVGIPVAILAHAEFATKVIERMGSDDLKRRFVLPAARGEKIGSLGVTEPGAGSDVAAIRTKAERDGEDYVVNGSKVFITNGTISDFITTAVRTGGQGVGGISLIVVPSDSSGISRRRLLKTATHASDTAEITFEDVRVPAKNLLGEENAGFRYIMQGFEGERLVLSVIACSQMRLMFETAKEWGHDRKAFGQPLLGFQVWQHRLADVLANITAAEALTYACIEKYVLGEPANAEISMAKLFSTEMARHVAHECAQIHGGMALMEESLMARLYRDVMGFTIGAGTSETMRGIIAKSCGLTG